MSTGRPSGLWLLATWFLESAQVAKMIDVQM